MVLTQEQFNRVIVAIGERLIPVPQKRPSLIPKNPVEDMGDLLFESKFRFSKPELQQLIALMDLPERIVLPIEYVTSGATMLLIVLFRLSYPTPPSLSRA